MLAHKINLRSIALSTRAYRKFNEEVCSHLPGDLHVCDYKHTFLESVQHNTDRLEEIVAYRDKKKHKNIVFKNIIDVIEDYDTYIVRSRTIKEAYSKFNGVSSEVLETSVEKLDDIIKKVEFLTTLTDRYKEYNKDALDFEASKKGKTLFLEHRLSMIVHQFIL